MTKATAPSAREYRTALAELKRAVEREQRARPFSLNVRQALTRADLLLARRPMPPA